jgi:predicted DNA-binding transcriptional regulator YafY
MKIRSTRPFWREPLKSDRLLSELMLLQGYGRLSTRAIAERLEISTRTAHRDMEALSISGVPIVAYRGAQGGWELEKSWRTQVPGLDDAELRGLLMTQPATLGRGKLAAAAQRAFDKLMASLPAAARSQAESIRARLHFDPAGWHMDSEDLSMLPAVQEALAQDRKLVFGYVRADGEASRRTVEPFGIVCKQASWYLVARTAKGMRTFRVSRMRDAVVLALKFTRPARFDLVAYWKRSTSELFDRSQRFTATLDLSSEAASHLRRWCTVIPAKSHSAQNRAQGWAVFDVEFEHRRQAQFVVLGLGSSVRAIAPAWLRDTVAEQTTRAAQFY